jgi:hypothetical protein
VTVLEQTAEARGLPAKSSSEAKAKRPKKDKLVREKLRHGLSRTTQGSRCSSRSAWQTGYT